MSTTTTTSSIQQLTVPSWQDNPPNDATDQPFQALARGDRIGVLKLRGIPSFKDPYAKRQWIREHMAAAFRFFGKQGYGEGVSGHISVRGKQTQSPYSTQQRARSKICQIQFFHTTSG